MRNNLHEIAGSMHVVVKIGFGKCELLKKLFTITCDFSYEEMFHNLQEVFQYHWDLEMKVTSALLPYPVSALKTVIPREKSTVDLEKSKGAFGSEFGSKRVEVNGNPLVGDHGHRMFPLGLEVKPQPWPLLSSITALNIEGRVEVGAQGHTLDMAKFRLRLIEAIINWP